jgi:hypothetical protein
MNKNMKKFLFGSLLIIVVALSAQAVSASPERVPAINNKSGKSVLIPAHAVQLADNVFSLGLALDEERGDVVEGYAIVHRKKGYGHKPDHNPGNGKGGGKGDSGSSCYEFLAKDVKWKISEDWIVNSSNPDGISDDSVFSILDNGITKWEDAADGDADGSVSADILGSGSTTSAVLNADTISTDGLNEVYFDLLEEGTIGVTIVWGVFSGPPFARELREWDQVYNTFYEWSDSGEALKMDLDNIVTHELGHSVGLGDLYEDSCSEETMYGYGTEGEIKKRDLSAGDIEGISKLY